MKKQWSPQSQTTQPKTIKLEVEVPLLRWDTYEIEAKYTESSDLPGLIKDVRRNWYGYKGRVVPGTAIESADHLARVFLNDKLVCGTKYRTTEPQLEEKSVRLRNRIKELEHQLKEITADRDALLPYCEDQLKASEEISFLKENWGKSHNSLIRERIKSGKYYNILYHIISSQLYAYSKTHLVRGGYSKNTVFEICNVLQIPFKDFNKFITLNSNLLIEAQIYPRNSVEEFIYHNLIYQYNEH